MIYPPKIDKNDKVGLVCPASGITAKDLPLINENIKELGFEAIFAPHTNKHNRFMSGSDTERANDINALFANQDIKAIFSIRGGYGSGRLLDLIDYELIRKNPKIFTGISDITILQNALLAKAELISFSGLLLHKEIGKETLRTLNMCLNQEEIIHEEQTFIKKGTASGELIGGCLSLFVSLIGTDYLPNPTGKILILEDVHSEPYQIDRMLKHLELAGIFNKVNGVIFGNYLNCIAKDSNDGTVEEVINEYAEKMPCPTVINFNYGHQYNTSVIPLGAKTEISSGKKTVSFNL